MSDSRLYIGNLSYETTESDLRTFLADAGVISSVSSMMDRVTGRSRGFAFVDMASADEAQKAVEMFNQKELRSRALVVNMARPREDRPPRSNSAVERSG